MQFKPADFFIFLLILVFAVFSISNSGKNAGSKVLINANGTEFQYSLSKNGFYEVEGELGITKIEISDSKVRIVDSACPNKTCVHQGWGKTIVCLPNKVIVTVLNDEDFDGIAQ